MLRQMIFCSNSSGQLLANTSNKLAILSPSTSASDAITILEKFKSSLLNSSPHLRPIILTKSLNTSFFIICNGCISQQFNGTPRIVYPACVSGFLPLLKPAFAESPSKIQSCLSLAFREEQDIYLSGLLSALHVWRFSLRNSRWSSAAIFFLYQSRTSSIISDFKIFLMNLSSTCQLILLFFEKLSTGVVKHSLVCES